MCSYAKLRVMWKKVAIVIDVSQYHFRITVVMFFFIFYQHNVYGNFFVKDGVLGY